MRTSQPQELIASAVSLWFFATTMATGAQAQTIDSRIGKLTFENGFQ